MRTGRLDRKIIIERLVESRDSEGGIVETWETWKTVWAAKIPLSGRESLTFNRPVASEVVRFETHFIEGLTAKDRISYDLKQWDILYFREVGRREKTEITCEVRD